jgi:hypothetical protein
VNFPQIEIRAGRKGEEFGSAAFDSVAKSGPRQESNLAAFSEYVQSPGLKG